jgi:hypothetical protein
MVTEIWEGVLRRGVNPVLKENYPLPLVEVRVTSNSPYVLQYLNFFLEHFRSIGVKPPETYTLAVLVN